MVRQNIIVDIIVHDLNEKSVKDLTDCCITDGQHGRRIDVAKGHEHVFQNLLRILHKFGHVVLQLIEVVDQLNIGTRRLAINLIHV